VEIHKKPIKTAALQPLHGDPKSSGAAGAAAPEHERAEEAVLWV